MSLTVVPVTFRQACAFIAAHHRHHKPPRGMVFCLGIEQQGQLVGVATVGRPVARAYQDGYTLEVNRTCTDGARNSNSMLYGAAWKAAKALGYRRLITYTHSQILGPVCDAAADYVDDDDPKWVGCEMQLARFGQECQHESCRAIRRGESGASLKAAGWEIIAERAPRSNWAESSRELRHLRDPDGPGGVQRSLWEAS